jgi:phosphomannomutase
MEEPVSVAAAEARIERWLAIDPDSRTRRTLAELLSTDPGAAAQLFNDRIAFGTAGLRAALGPGPRQMNRLVVAQTTAGLLRWLARQPTTSASGGTSTVVIGFDARHYSSTFAADVAAEVAAAGLTAEVLAGPTPTPVLAYAVLDRGAVAGIMITASHNPATDNGYKLYLSDGIQLVSPADSEIAAAIDDVAAAHDDLAQSLLDRLETADLSPADREDRLDRVRTTPVTTLLADARAALTTALDADPTISPERDDDPAAGSALAAGSISHLDDRPQRHHRGAAISALLTDDRDINVLYTAMHGVGGRHLLECFTEAGFPQPQVVPEQFEPDPEFPTAAFPNPEEAGALDLAYAQAEAGNPPPDIILANDPDADRLAVAVPDAGGNWARLTGDEVGALLADHIFRHRAGADHPVVASSIVSSRFINRLAEAHGAESVRTLTGFKWVARPMVDQPDATYLLGYEEALGYCVGDQVRDKDGVSAALVMAELAAGLKARGSNLRRRLDELAAEFGLYATSQVTVSLAEMSDEEQQQLKSRATSLDPTAVGAIAVQAVEHLAEGRTLPPTPGVIIDLEDESRIIIRPSGTEPKMKAYIEVIESTGDPAGYRQRAQSRLDALADAVAELVTDS